MSASNNSCPTTCRLCTNAPERNLRTALGVGPICVDCLEAGAECPKALHQAYLDTKAKGTKVPAEIVTRVTIHIGDNRYLPLKEFLEKASQLPAPCVERQPTEEEQEEMDLDYLLSLVYRETPTLTMWPTFKKASLLCRTIWLIQRIIYGYTSAIPAAPTFPMKETTYD